MHRLRSPELARKRRRRVLTTAAHRHSRASTPAAERRPWICAPCGGLHSASCPPANAVGSASRRPRAYAGRADGSRKTARPGPRSSCREPTTLATSAVGTRQHGTCDRSTVCVALGKPQYEVGFVEAVPSKGALERAFSQTIVRQVAQTVLEGLYPYFCRQGRERALGVPVPGGRRDENCERKSNEHWRRTPTAARVARDRRFV